MEGFLHLALSKHQVAIAGKIVDQQSGRALTGALAIIEAGPEAFWNWLSLRQKQSGGHLIEPAARPDRAVTSADGCFGFVDLPDGSYTLIIEGPPGLCYGTVKQNFVVQSDPEEAMTKSIVPIGLPATGARGLIQSQSTQEALPLAQVRIEDGEQSAHCDATGAFLITRVQPGKRRLSIKASGYHRRTVVAQIVQGAIVDIGTIFLEPNGA